MLIDAIEYSNKLKQEIEFNEREYDELEKQAPSLDLLVKMAENLAERKGLTLAMRILVDMMEKGEHKDAGD